MSRFLFLGDTPRTHNPINTKEYQKILKLYPTLSQEIQKHVEGVLYGDLTPLSEEDLYDNSDIVRPDNLILARQTILSLLDELETLTQEAQHIVLIEDSCFTNLHLKLLLRNYLGKENFKRYVRVVPIDYQSPADNDFLARELSLNHTLFLLGGSLSDTYSIHPSHYESYLFGEIASVVDDYHPKFQNKRYVGVCFGQQYLANILGIVNHTSSSITATIQGPAQFGPSNCHIEDLQYAPAIFAQILAGISNYGKNKHFSAGFTRTGYVHFDLLSSGGNLGMVPLITDEMTQTTVGWGTENGNVFAVQFHPELDLVGSGTTLQRQLRPILPQITPDHALQQEILRNFSTHGTIKQNINEAFYAYVIMEYLRDIILKYKGLESILQESNTPEPLSYHEKVDRLLMITASRVNHLLSPASQRVDRTQERAKWIEAIDKKSRLLLNHRLDWKVSRGLDEVSEIIGLMSLPEIISYHQQISGDPHYIVRDFGAGDGNTLNELADQLKGKDIVFYGVGDYIYFDLFTGLQKSSITDGIPHEILVLFVEKVVTQYAKTKEESTIQRLWKVLDSIEFFPNDTMSHSSMTSVKTSMFSAEGTYYLPQEIQQNFSHYLPMLQRLCEYTRQHTTDLVGDFFHNIYISKFLGLNINDEHISRINFQYAIRSTSHISGRQYMRVLSDFIFQSAKSGSIYLDNGIHQSYTSIPRIKELFELSRDVVDTQFKLIYDPNTNYFPSVIITKEFDYLEDDWERFLLPNMKIVSLSEAYRSTFFRLEYFLRNFIIANFKNQDVFWDFNTQIIETLQYIMQALKDQTHSGIPGQILDLINYIALHFHQEGISYNTIELPILLDYTIDDENLSQLLAKEVYIPEWMNIDAKRKY